jgi:putative sigma-54 modulation protein
MVNASKFKEEEEMGYRIDVIGRNVQITDTIRAYIWDKLSKIERFHNHIMHVVVTLEIHKLEHSCSIIYKIDHTQVKAHADSTDMYASIDRAVERINRLLSRYKSRIQDHHQKKLSMIDMQVNVLQRPFDEVEAINAEIEAANLEEGLQQYRAPRMVGTETKPLKTLTIEEAIMKMDLSGDHFLVFRAEEDQKLKVLYRRTDGNYGLIQPE